MLTPVSFAILAREAGPKRLGRVMAVVGIPMLLGPVGGPILGGWLIGAYGWRWIFLVQPAGRAVRARLGGDRVPKRSPGSVGKLRLHGPLVAVAGPGDLPVRGVI